MRSIQLIFLIILVTAITISADDPLSARDLLANADDDHEYHYQTRNEQGYSTVRHNPFHPENIQEGLLGEDCIEGLMQYHPGSETVPWIHYDKAGYCLQCDVSSWEGPEDEVPEGTWEQVDCPQLGKLQIKPCRAWYDPRRFFDRPWKFIN